METAEDKVNILLVDDRPDGRLVLKAVLESPDYNLVEAGSGPQALSKLRESEFAVVLLDVQMPGMDGLQTAAAIRAREETRDVPIIFITGVSKEAGSLFKGYEQGAVDYLLKPIDDHALRSKVAVFARLFRNARLIRIQADDLKRQAAELAVINKELEAFSYSLTHDMQGPVRNIFSFCQLIAKKYGAELSPEARENFKYVQTAASRMASVIEGMLSLFRLSRAPMGFEKVDLSALAHTIMEELRKGEMSRVVDVEIEPGLTAMGDVRLLHAILYNLFSNAWKFTASRQREAKIRFRAFDQDGERVFALEDNGIGFDMAYGHKLYKPFQRLHGAEDVPGTGIGLALVKRVVQRHGGRVWAEGRPDQGATFFFTLARPAPKAGSVLTQSATAGSAST